MGNVGKPLASLWNGTKIGATAPPSERQEMKENKFHPGWDEERVRRVLANYEPQTREEAVGPNRNRLTSVCRQRRYVETLDKSLRQRENRATYWSSKDVIGRPAYQ